MILQAWLRKSFDDQEQETHLCKKLRCEQIRSLVLLPPKINALLYCVRFEYT